MKDFAIDSKGDITLFKNDFEMVNGDELTRQKAELLIGTNKGEWFLNKKQGINFRIIYTKNPNTEAIKEEILQALKMLDDTFNITLFDCKTSGRKMYIYFYATNENGEAVAAKVSDGYSRSYIENVVNNSTGSSNSNSGYENSLDRLIKRLDGIL